MNGCSDTSVLAKGCQEMQLQGAASLRCAAPRQHINLYMHVSLSFYRFDPTEDAYQPHPLPLRPLAIYSAISSRLSRHETVSQLLRPLFFHLRLQSAYLARSSACGLEMSASLPAYTSTDHARENPRMTFEASLPGADGQGNLPPFNATAKKILRQLDHQINASPPTCPKLEDHGILGPERFADIRTRFLLWTGNLGVRRRPEDPRALDRRLIDAPDVANRVHEILRDLQDLLSQCKPSST